MNNLFREIKTKIYLRKDATVNFPAHVHDDIEVVYVLEGVGLAICDGKHYTLSAGNIFMVFPEQVHSYHDFPDGAYILLIIKPSRLVYLEKILNTQLPVSPLCKGTPELEQLLINALEEYRNRGDSLIVDGYLTAFLGKLLSGMELRHRTVTGDVVSKVIQYCAKHYQDNICQQDLCRDLHLSRSYISRVFSDSLNISFPEYMNALRLNGAISLLQDDRVNMTQVAERAGFPTIRTFNRVFFKQYGCSPSDYRKRLRNKE